MTPNEFRLAPSSVTSSSELLEGRYRHRSRFAFDGNLRTAWAEGVPGPGRGEWVEAQFASAVRVTRIYMTTGFEKYNQSGDLFVLNAHLRRVRFEFDNGRQVTHTAGAGDRWLQVARMDVVTRRVRVVAEDIWEGLRWPDLSISEIEIYGTNP